MRFLKNVMGRKIHHKLNSPVCMGPFIAIDSESLVLPVERDTSLKTPSAPLALQKQALAAPLRRGWGFQCPESKGSAGTAQSWSDCPGPPEVRGRVLDGTKWGELYLEG